ncbi:MAG: anti-sigma F factor antagonist [Clostridia bacterium]|nr:anti-sigma F factor antagonist [Clostridia bacterium]
MKVNVERVGNALVARVAGELDMLVAAGFRTQVESALDREAARNLILNFTEVSFIDSSGLGAILGRYKRISQTGGIMAIVNPQPQVKRILELSGIMRIMSTYPSEEEAIKKL